MANTNIRSRQIKDGDVLRADVNTSTSGSALITKVIAGTGISISSTGADAGTGDVTITATGGGGSGSGSVTSVAFTAPTNMSVTGSPVTSSGTLALSFSSGYQAEDSTENDFALISSFKTLYNY